MKKIWIVFISICRIDKYFLLQNSPWSLDVVLCSLKAVNFDILEKSIFEEIWMW